MNKFATRKSLYGMVTAATLSLLLVGPTMAQEDLTGASETEVVVTGGDLTVNDPTVDTDFAGVEITGEVQFDQASLGDLTVADLTGTGAGWSVSVKASQFDGLVGSNVLPTSSLSMAGVTVDPATVGVTSPEPTVNLSSATDIDIATATPIGTAAANTGMGTYDFSFAADSIELTIPADVKADTYSSTLTFTLAATP